jgi:hypothetical protein
MPNTNKIRELEENIEQSSQKLSGVFDLFSSAIDEMKTSFSGIFGTSSSLSNYFISPELEKFEKSWNKNFEPEDLNL